MAVTKTNPIKKTLMPFADRSISLQELGNFSSRLTVIMDELREQMLAPHPRKSAPEYTSSQLGALCEIDRTKVNYLLQKKDKLPQGTCREGSRTRIFSLSEVQEWIRLESDITQRQEGTLGEIVIIANFKGGSTKTTTTASLGQGLTLRGRKVLLVDLDPQASLTELCGLYVEEDINEEDTVMPFIYGDETNLDYAIKSTYWSNLDIIPAATSLFGAEFIIPSTVTQNPRFEFWDILNKGLQLLRNRYDYILIDTAPSLSYMTINALMSANAMIMPLVPESLDFVSSVQFWNLFSELALNFTGINPTKRFDFINVLLTKVDNSSSSSAPVVRSWIERAYGEWVLPVEIPISSAVGSEALEFSTIYDVSKWAGSNRTLSRIRDPFDHLCKLIDDKFVAKWNQAASNAKGYT
jgi:chromosome partitioning protein